MRIEKKLKIGEVSKLLDIPAYVLRYWENEFKELRPTKSRSGQRLYGDKDILVIKKIAQLRYNEKLTISGCHTKLTSPTPDRNTSEIIKKNNDLLNSEIQNIKKGLQELLEDLR